MTLTPIGAGRRDPGNARLQPGDIIGWHSRGCQHLSFHRDEENLQAARDYIHNNPVKAGLAERQGEWEWSSARLEPGVPRKAK